MTQANAAGPRAGAVATDPSDSHRKDTLALLTLSAIGVVYGDIGTSPIYAFRQALLSRPAVEETSAEILGLLSLIVWSLNFSASTLNRRSWPSLPVVSTAISPL